MQIVYSINSTRAIADLVELEDNVWQITRISVPEAERGKGIGSRLLDTICEHADAEAATLLLGVQPSGPLGYRALVAWYKRRGFIRVDKGIMKRTPRK